MAEKKPGSKAPNQVASEIIKRQSKTPLTMYKLKDWQVRLTSNQNFFDAVLMLLAFVAVVAALPSYPLIIIVIIMLLLFVATIRHPLLGLVVLMFVTMPAVIYQAPSLAWAFLLVISLCLILGYMHFRTIGFAFLIVALAFSPLGLVFDIPALLIAILVVGYKRGVALAVATVLVIVMFSGTTGVQNTAYVLYNASLAHQNVVSTGLIQYLSPIKHGLTITQFIGGMGSAFANFTSGPVMAGVSATLGLLIVSLGTHPLQYVIQTLGLMGIVVAVEWFAVNSRSRYKGTKAALLGVGYPLLYFLVGIMFNTSITYILPLTSFAIAISIIYLLEFYEVNIVKALDVRKQDIRMKFGEAFEDLHSSDVTQTFASIGNYEATKREIRDAIITPLEERGIARAYKITPAKGILLFGPPGTGKTMMMRALANEVHAGFFLVKTSNLVSAFSGETEHLISNVFTIAKKNAPSVLFFDEIDSIAKSRDSAEVDEVHKQALTQLLMEIDGFQSSTGVIVVGATNMPQVLDHALMRPGRLDKIIYIPLPDFNGRKKIFQMYLKGLPLGDSVNIDELAEKTERYSGADIKGICEGASQVISLEATEQHKVLEISQDDILGVIKSMKPSTSLAQLESYNKFKIDFERRLFEEGNVEKTEKTSTSDVIGLDDVKKAVAEAIEIPIMHPELIKKYDIKIINGILLFGPPGTGKTMMMRAIANEMKGVTMLEINGADLSEKSSENAVEVLREIFNRARENIPSIVFIDELDTVIPKREVGGEMSSQVTGALLEEMDGIKKLSGVLVIAATNRPEKLDPAILRPGRFDKISFVRPPNTDERAQMFKAYLKKVPLRSDIDFKKLGDETNGFTGADIANVCREMKIKALEESVKSGEEFKIGTPDLEAIIASVRPSAPEEALDSYMEFMSKHGER